MYTMRGWVRVEGGEGRRVVGLGSLVLCLLAGRSVRGQL